MAKQKPKRISLNGIEYKVTEEEGDVRLERKDPAGFTVVNVFKSRPDSRERLEEFKKQAAALVLQAVDAAKGERT
ncbi:hypothetical protein EDD75_0261 [Thermodesulfitimonas autotrophica]|uniref:Uncharacterized protein n=1 Tax=Thermodesulfitimonas autotrophica TaxID=1894989 RepID=A0A3N5BIF5_9THEO|nr:hypothetical protein [Thermodesulfitimonas autotrophica]RPF49448.1 hypothetical protein EDD75_0261 [Thermodesulfitimonas autotrophica]